MVAPFTFKIFYLYKTKASTCNVFKQKEFHRYCSFFNNDCYLLGIG
jgi:hypothetical protein